MPVHKLPVKQQAAGQYSYLLNVFDDLAEENPKELQSKVQVWLQNYHSQIDGKVKAAFSRSNPNKKRDMREIKLLIAKLNDIF